MTVTKETARSGPYEGNGLATAFAYSFRVDAESHLRVVKSLADGADTLLELSKDYQVTNVGAPTGGDVVLTTALSLGEKLTIIRDQPFTQSTDLVNQGPFFAEDVELGFDHAVMRDQELAEHLSRAVSVPLGESTDPKDYLAQMQALVAQALAAGQGDSVVSVLTHGAVGDAGDDLSLAASDAVAFQAAIDKAIELGLDYVVVPVPPDPDKAYFVDQDLDNAQLIDWRIDPRANVVGAHNIPLKQSRIKGARVLDPTPTVSTVFANNGRYNHQCVAGFDLDDALIVSWQRNLFIHIESFDHREVVFAKTTDGTTWQSWTDPVNPFADATVCTNPITITGGQPRMGASWIVNHARAAVNASQKLWMGCTTTADPDTNARFLLTHKTTAEGKFTVYSFWQHATTGQIKLFQGDAKPGADWTARFTHEGHPDLNFWCHATMIDSKGRLLMSVILGDQINDSFGDMRRLPCVLYAEDPRPTDPTEIVWKLGPSIDIGTTNGPGPQWEWGMYEASPGFFRAIIRHNEGEGGAADNFGRRQFSAVGDGVTFGGWRETGVPMHRTRVKYIGLNDKFAATAMVDRFSNRSNGVMAFEERGGALIPGPTMSPGEPESVKANTIAIASANDTVLATSGLDFTGATVEVRVKQAGTDQDLVGSGFTADYAGDTIDLAHWRFLETGHTFIAENGGFVETVALPNDTATQVLSLTNDLTTGAPVILGLNELGNDTLTIGDSVFVDAAADNVTFTGATDTYSGLLVYEPGLSESLVYSDAADTLWTPALDITEGDLAVYMVQNVVGATFVVPELDFITDTATDSVTLLEGRNAGDEVIVSATSGRRWQVPTLVKDEKTGRVVQVGSLDYLNESIGREPTASWFEPEDLPRADYLNVVLRKNAAAEWADDGHLPTYAVGTGLATIPGDGSAVHSLPPYRGQLAVPYRHNTLPEGNDSIILFVLGTPQHHLTVELANNGLSLVREYKIGRYRGGRADFDARDEEVTRRLEAAVDVEQVFTFQYDPETSQVMINDRLFKLQWPFALYWGNGFILNEEPSPTSRVLTVDVAGVTWTALPQEFRFEAEEDDRPPAPNLIIDPGFDFDPEKGGGSDYALVDRMPILPGLSCRQTGGASATLRRASNSVDASEAQFDGLRHSLLLTISAAGTDWLELDFEFDGAQSVSQGPFSFALWAANESGPAVGEANHADGIAARLTWVHNLGAGADDDQEKAVGYARIPRFNDRLWYPIVVPQANETFDNVIGPENYGALRLGIEPGRACTLRFRGADFYQGAAPRRMPRPDLVEVERRVKRFYYRRAQEQLSSAVTGNVTNPLAIAHAISATQVDWIEPLPAMAGKPEFTAVGVFAGNPLGTTLAHGGTIEQMVVTDDNNSALLRMRMGGATLSVGEAVAVFSTSPLSQGFAGDDSLYRFELAGAFDIEDEGDIELSLDLGTGTTNVLSPPTDGVLKPSYGQDFDRPPLSAGDSIFISDMTLSDESEAELVKITESSGEETLGLGSDYTVDIGPPASVTLLGGDTIGADDTFDLRKPGKLGQAVYLAEQRLTSGQSLTAASTKQSSGAWVFDARQNRFQTQFSSETATVTALSGFVASPRRKEAIDELLVELVAAGVWAKLDVAYDLAAEDAATGLINWKGSASKNLTTVNGPTFTANLGYSFNGTDQYLDANFDPTDNTDPDWPFQYLQDDAEASIFVVVDTPDASTNWLLGGGTNTLGISPRGTTDLRTTRCNDNVNQQGTALMPGSTLGFVSVGRSVGTDYTYAVENGIGVVCEYPISQASTGLPNAINIGRRGTGYGTGTVAWMMLGAHLTSLQRQRAARALTRYYKKIGAIA